VVVLQWEIKSMKDRYTIYSVRPNGQGLVPYTNTSTHQKEFDMYPVASVVQSILEKSYAVQSSYDSLFSVPVIHQAFKVNSTTRVPLLVPLLSSWMMDFGVFVCNNKASYNKSLESITKW
jgi:hypothetical protein